jgi:hypothetical protein
LSDHCTADDNFHFDGDGDGHGSPNGPSLPCTNGRRPSGYVQNADDCDDTDPTRFRLYYADADGDGAASTDKLCAGSEAPAGYVPSIGSHADCDDSNPAISFPYLLDADGDGSAAPNAAIVCGPEDHAPPNTVFSASYPGDCDDTDPTLRSWYYQDLDGDRYAAAAEVSVCGNPDLGPPPGFGYLANGLYDCDDTRADVNPDALELWTDGVDADCDGYLDPLGYACPYGEACPDPFTVAIDSTCGSADLVITVAVAEPRCLDVDWKIWIGNQGTQPIPEYTLTLEGADGMHATFQIRDALAPGTQYPYAIPRRLWLGRYLHELSGDVRFTVTTTMADCNLLNNTVSRSAFPTGDCLL